MGRTSTSRKTGRGPGEAPPPEDDGPPVEDVEKWDEG
jgi:hypothetical protein